MKYPQFQLYFQFAIRLFVKAVTLLGESSVQKAVTRLADQDKKKHGAPNQRAWSRDLQFANLTHGIF